MPNEAVADEEEKLAKMAKEFAEEEPNLAGVDMSEFDVGDY